MRRSAITVLVCGAIIITLSMGIRAAFALFLKPVSMDLNVGRQVFAMSLAIATLITGLGQPFAGAIADRFGSVLVTMFGALLYGAGLLLASFSQSSAGLHLTFGVLIGIAMTAAGMPVVMGAVARAVPPEKRSMAFGIVTAGGSFGQFAMIPIGQQLLSTWDWRVAAQLFTILAGVIFFSAWGLRGEKGSGAPPAGSQSLRAALREAGGHSGFQLLTLSFFVCGFHVSFISTHLPAFLTDRGISGNIAAQALAFVGLFNIFGSYLSGAFGNKYRKRAILTWIYLLRAVIFLPMIFLPMTPVLALAFSAAMGFLYLSTVAPTSGIVAQIFGVRYLSTLFGFVFLSHQIGGFLGAYLGGYLFDKTGSYNLMWWIAIGLSLVAAALCAPIRDNPIQRPVPAAA